MDKKFSKNEMTPAIVVAGTHSGVGKTTIVTGIIGALVRKGYSVQSFKIGPDYIDTGFHKKANGCESFNLDSWLMSKTALINFYNKKTDDKDIAVIEGVMGLFDGGKNGVSSTAEIAKLLGVPVVLVVDCKSMGQSVGAIVKGFVEYDEELNVAGVIANRLGTKSHEQIIRETLENLEVELLGCLPRNEKLVAPSRHLGLVPTTEFSSEDYVEEAICKVEENIDFTNLMAIANLVQKKEFVNDRNEPIARFKGLKIGIAKDEAFSFYYPSSLEVLERIGAELVYFSPIHDEKLPKVAGLILGGGFPESFLNELMENKTMIEDIKQKAKMGMPIYAECGGYMYLCNSIRDFENKEYIMCDIVPAKAIMCDKLQRVGYVTGKLKKDCAFGDKGDLLKGHEFHFSKIEMLKEYDKAFELYSNRRGRMEDGGYISENGNIIASYLHIHFSSCIKQVEKYMRRCAEYEREHND